MDSNTLLGVIAWAAIVTGYVWWTWNLARAGRAPRGPKAELAMPGGVTEYPGHLPADAAAVIVVRRPRIRHTHAALGNTRRDASNTVGRGR
jgi:hypothetical protein